MRGTVTLTEEFQRLPAANTAATNCPGDLVRVFRGEGLPPAPAAQPANADFADPIPGPTLRARVGDLVQLAFVNTVNSNRFDLNLDVEACMEVGEGGKDYPVGFNDSYPNCLHASSTANIHFHGTHTNPDSTGDNVYLQIRPLPRDNQGNLTTTPAEAMVGFDEFFAECTQQLASPLHVWPSRWADMPPDWVAKQTELLMAYQAANPDQPLWDKDQALINDGWPQYYIGAVPYCFALPAYTEATWPPPPGSTSPNMGQAPGTHWYHAHKHGSTAINVMNGMTGAFIIEGEYDDALNSAYGSYELEGGQHWNSRSQPVLVINQLGTTPSVLSAGQTPRQFAVNGRMVPNVHMQQGEIQLWRIVNTSHRSAAYFMAPEGGLEWRQLAQDGVQLANQNYRDSANTPFYLAPGNRVDLLVRAPMNDMSTGILIQEVTARAAVKPTPANPGPTDPKPGKPLMTVIVSGPPVMLYGVASQMEFLTAAPRQPPFLADITDEELIKNSYSQKTLEFNSTQNPGLPPVKHTINGIQFEDGKATVRVVLNTVEEWTVKNLTTTAPGPIDHPFHIHINPFQITEVFDPNEKLVDPATGQLEAVLVSGKTQSVPRYVTDQSQLTDPNNPFAHRQCFLDPNNEATWSVAGACGPQPPQSSLVWWDVFAIPSARVEGGAAIPGYFKMRSRFVDYPGVYVLHCHILIHEDRGMMFSVEVVGPRPILVQHH